MAQGTEKYDIETVGRFANDARRIRERVLGVSVHQIAAAGGPTAAEVHALENGETAVLAEGLVIAYDEAVVQLRPDVGYHLFSGLATVHARRSQDATHNQQRFEQIRREHTNAGAHYSVLGLDLELDRKVNVSRCTPLSGAQVWLTWEDRKHYRELFITNAARHPGLIALSAAQAQTHPEFGVLAERRYDVFGDESTCWMIGAPPSPAITVNGVSAWDPLVHIYSYDDAWQRAIALIGSQHPDVWPLSWALFITAYLAKVCMHYPMYSWHRLNQGGAQAIAAALDQMHAPALPEHPSSEDIWRTGRDVLGPWLAAFMAGEVAMDIVNAPADDPGRYVVDAAARIGAGYRQDKAIWIYSDALSALPAVAGSTTPVMALRSDGFEIHCPTQTLMAWEWLPTSRDRCLLLRNTEGYWRPVQMAATC